MITGEEELLKLDNQLCFTLYAGSRAVTRIYRPLLERLSLSYPQYLVMLVLWEGDVVKVTDIGRKLHLDSGTLTPLLKRMESEGFITRKRSGEDERAVHITLTEQGRNLKKKAVEVPRELFCRSGLSPDEFLSLKKTISDLIERMKATDEEDPCERKHRGKR